MKGLWLKANGLSAQGKRPVGSNKMVTDDDIGLKHDIGLLFDWSFCSPLQRLPTTPQKPHSPFLSQIETRTSRKHKGHG